jgi:hypothetical protein
MFATMLKHTAVTCRRRYAAGRLARGLAAVALLALLPGEVASRSDRFTLFPKLQAGQVIAYQISLRGEKSTKTQSSLVVAEAPGDTVLDVHALLRIEVFGVAPASPRATIHARVWFQSLDSEANAPVAHQQQSPGGVPIEITIFATGRVDAVKGADQLTPNQQQAWHQWVSRFVAAATFPTEGVKIAQKWRSEETEQAPSPIASLTWMRESTYVRNEPCRPMRMSLKGDLEESDEPSDICAVILTTATLKQLSHPKDTTPDDFRVRQLHTSGTARGNNKTITYISLKSGLVVRASDEADQAMAVTIAKADGTNRVHYDVQAKSSAEVLLVSGATAASSAAAAAPLKNP